MGRFIGKIATNLETNESNLFVSSFVVTFSDELAGDLSQFFPSREPLNPGPRPAPALSASPSALLHYLSNMRHGFILLSIRFPISRILPDMPNLGDIQQRCKLIIVRCVKESNESKDKTHRS